MDVKLNNNSKLKRKLQKNVLCMLCLLLVLTPLLSNVLPVLGEVSANTIQDVDGLLESELVDTNEEENIDSFENQTIDDESTSLVNNVSTAAQGDNDNWDIFKYNILPNMRGLATVTSNDNIIIGGRYLTSDSTYIFDGFSWNAGPNLIQARRNTNFVVYEGNLYKVGGTNSNGNTVNTVWRLSDDGQSWETHSTLPSAVTVPGLATLNGALYVVGGYSGSNRNWVQIYDGTSWTNISSTDHLPLAYSPSQGIVTYNNRIYITGVNKVEVYSYDGAGPDGQKWGTEPSLPAPGISGPHVSVVYNDRIYAIGGTSVFSWKPGEPEWTIESSLPYSRLRHGGSVLGNHIYVIGGSPDGGASDEANTVFRYPGSIISENETTWAGGVDVTVTGIDLTNGATGDILGAKIGNTPVTDLAFSKNSGVVGKGSTSTISFKAGDASLGIAGENDLEIETVRGTITRKNAFTVKGEVIWDTMEFIGNQATGEIDNQLNVDLKASTFAITDGEMTSGTHFKATNVPDGLTIKVTATEARKATITLEGKAASNNNISNLKIEFLPQAFNQGDPTHITNKIAESISINWEANNVEEPPPVVAEVTYNSVGPSKLHKDDDKKLTVVGRGFRNIARQKEVNSNHDVQYALIPQSGGSAISIASERLQIISDTHIQLNLPKDLAVGTYDLQLNHPYFNDKTFSNALTITNEARFKSKKFEEIILENKSSKAKVKKVAVKGPFEEYEQKKYRLDDVNQVVALNNYLMYKGTKFEIDKSDPDPSKHTIVAEGRLFVNGGSKTNTSVFTTYTLHDGNFELTSDRFAIVTSGDKSAYDYLKMNMPVKIESISFIDGGINIVGNINIELGIGGKKKITGEAEIDALQIRRSGIDLVSRFNIATDAKMGPIESSELRVGIDTITPKYAFGGTAMMPPYNIGFDIDLTVKRNKLDSLRFSIIRDIQIGNTGAQFRRIGAGIENLADQSGGPLTILALAGLSDYVTPKISNNYMMNGNNIKASLSKYHFGATGDLAIYHINVSKLDMLVVADPSGYPGYKNPGFKAEANIDILDVIIGNILVKYFKGESISGIAKTRVQVPKDIKMIGGQKLASANISVDETQMKAGLSVIGVGFKLAYHFAKKKVDFKVDVIQTFKNVVNFGFKAGKTIYNGGKQTVKFFGNAFKSGFKTLKGPISGAGKKLFGKGKKTFKSVKKKAKKAWKKVSGWFSYENDFKRGVMYASAAVSPIRIQDFITFGELSDDQDLMGEDIVGVEVDIEVEDENYFEAIVEVKNADSNLRVYTTVTKQEYQLNFDKTTDDWNAYYDEEEHTVYFKINTLQATRLMISQLNGMLDGNDITVFDLEDLNLQQFIDTMLVDVEILTANIDEKFVGLFEITNGTTDTQLVKPDGSILDLEFNSTSDSHNAYYDSEESKVYVKVDVDQMGEWMIRTPGTNTDIDIYELENPAQTMKQIIANVLGTIITTENMDHEQFKALFKVRKHENHTIAVYEENGTPYPLIYDQQHSDWNAFEKDGYVYFVAELGVWGLNVEKEDIDVFDIKRTMSIADIMALDNIVPTIYFEIDNASPSYQAHLVMKNVTDDIQLRMPNGQLYPLVYDQAANDWNAHRNQHTLSILVEVNQNGIWAIEGLGNDKLEILTYDQRFDNIAPLILGEDGEAKFFETINIDKAGRYLLEIENGQIGKTVIERPDGTTVEMIVEEVAHNRNVIFQESEKTLYVTVNVPSDKIGHWTVLSELPMDVVIYEVPPIPVFKEIEVNQVQGERNKVNVKWEVENPRDGTKVKMMIVTNKEEMIGSTIAEDLAPNGEQIIDLPDMMPGTYYLALTADSEDFGPIFKVANTSVQVTAERMLTTPTELKAVSTGNGEIKLQFKDEGFEDVTQYRILFANAEGEIDYFGPQHFVDPENSADQTAILSGLKTNETYYVTVMSMLSGTNTEVSDSQENDSVIGAISLPAEPIEVFLPAPSRPSVNVTILPIDGKKIDRTYTAFYDEEEKETTISTNKANIEVTSDQDNTSFELYVNFEKVGETLSGNSATFELDQLEERDYTIEIYAYNEAGDLRSTYQKLYVDQTAPYLFIDAPITGQVFDHNRVLIKGQTEAGSTLQVNDTRIQQLPNGEFMTLFAIADSMDTSTNGAIELNFTVEDEVGNETIHTLEVLKGIASDNPEDTDVQPNLQLEALSVSVGQLSEQFNPAEMQYDVFVGNDVNEITVNAFTLFEEAKINGTTVDGLFSETKSLSVGENLITLTLSAEQQTDVEYTIKVHRAANTNNALSDLKVKTSADNNSSNLLGLSPSFFSGTKEYSVTVPYETENVWIEPTTASSTTSITVKGGSSIASGSSYNMSDLQIGENKITLVVTAEDEAKKEYELTIIRELFVNASLKSLSVEGVTLSPVFNSQVYSYEATVDHTVSSVEISAEALASESTVEINGVDGKSLVLNLEQGENDVTIQVTSASGEKKLYLITIVKTVKPTPPIVNDVVKITFDWNQGDTEANSVTKTVLHGKAIGTLPTVPTRAGYTFVGWNTKADGTGSAFTATIPIISNQTVYAQWRVIPSSGGGGGGSLTPSQPSEPTQPSQPEQQVITVPVETGNVGSGTTVTQTPITRTTDQSGKVKDEVTLTLEQAKETTESITQSGQNTARIVIPDTKDEVGQVNINVPKEATKEFGDKNVNLEIFTENVRIIVPQGSMATFNDDLFFRVTPIKEESQRKEVENRARLEQIVKDVTKDDKVAIVSRPMTIETNMQSRPVTLVLPLRDVQLPTDEADRAKFLNELVIFIEHSDGEKRLVKGKTVDYKEGQLGLEFEVNKFSTFTILQMEGFVGNLHEAYIKGFEDGTFKPNNTVTRAEIAAMIARNLGYDDTQKVVSTFFSDIQVTHWAAGVIEFTKQQGLMKGDNLGKFNPNSGITRAEMAVIVARYKQLTLLTDVESTKAFPDIAGHWAMKAIAANKQAGIISGYQDGTFRPNGNLSRAEAVKVINRMFDRGPLYGVEKPTFKDVPTTHWAFYEVEEAAQNHLFSLRDKGGENLVK